jgi:hypothetical protein
LPALLADIVRVLHLAHIEDGHGWRNGKRILELAGSSQFKMSDVLKDRKDGNLTRSTSGTVKGALPFMAPEMLFRKAGEKVGQEADVCPSRRAT